TGPHEAPGRRRTLPLRPQTHVRRRAPAVVWRGRPLRLAGDPPLRGALLARLAGAAGEQEEPSPRRRFGSEYETYRREVPRWLPRVAGAAGTQRKADGSPRPGFGDRARRAMGRPGAPCLRPGYRIAAGGGRGRK